MKKKTLKILFMNTFMYIREERKLSEKFEELSGHKHIFEVISCLTLPSTAEIEEADIVFCCDEFFIEQYQEIVQLIKVNYKVWLAVHCSSQDFYLKVKNLGVKFTYRSEKVGKEILLNRELVYNFLIKYYLDSTNPLLGAGLNFLKN